MRVPGASVRPDLVFTRWRLAVFLDGCFWHGCPDHQRVPRSNRSYWVPKLATNVERDHRVDAALTDAGWAVVRIWEHVPVDAAVGQIQVALAGRQLDSARST